MSEFINTWSAIGLSTDPVDRRLFEKRVRKIYQDAGMGEPESFAWFKSPLQGAIAYLMLVELGNVRVPGWEKFGENVDLSGRSAEAAVFGKLKESVSQEVLSELTNNMADVVNERVYNLVESRICDAVLSELPSAVSASEWDRVKETLGGTVEEKVWKNTRRTILDDFPNLSTTVFRQGLGPEVSIDVRCLYDYLSKVCGLTEFESFGGYSDRESSVLWWPFERICVVAERYSEIHRDEYFMLHYDQGPAVKYRDDWGIYSYRGIVVAPWVITDPEKITPLVILAERDVTLRSVLVDRYGEPRFSRDSGIQIFPLSHYREWAKSETAKLHVKTAGFRGRGLPPPLYLVHRDGV